MPLTIPPPLQGCASPEAFLVAVQKDPAVVYNHYLTIMKLVTDMEMEGTKLTAMVSDFEAQNANFATEISTLKAVNEALKDITANRSVSTTLQPARLTPRHPDPDKFNGNKDELLQFTTQLKLKLNINADHYTSSKSDIAYAISRLEGNALSQILPLVKSATNVDILNIDAFFKILEAAFGDPDKKGTAQRKIRSLRQTNKPFHEYLADFQRYIVDTDYNEDARLAALIEGLSQELKNMLMYIPTPRTMVEAIETLQSLENRRKMFGSNSGYTSGHTNRRPGQSTPTGSSNAHGPTRPTPTSSTRPGSGAPAASNNTLNDPMDLSSSRRRGPLTPAERERRISLGLCLYCGGAGHVAKNCPNAKKGGKLGLNEATTRIEEVVSEDEESGKA
jgi:hypothetical protein